MKRAMKRVGLEASGILSRRSSGVGVYGQSLSRALSRGSFAAYTLLFPWSRWIRPSFQRPDVDLPAAIYVSGKSLGRRFSLVHALDTRLPKSYAGPLVATVFDILSALPMSAELRLSSESFRRKKVKAYEEIASRSSAIVTLSARVRDDFLDRFPTRARLEVIPPGVAAPVPPAPDASAELALLGLERPFLLSVGALCPRKNIETIVRAFLAVRPRHPGLKLVLAGEPSYGWKGSAGEEAVRRGGEAVLLPGYLSRERLWALYSSAEALLHLSHYEGYGMTVLEALSRGTPVVASDRGGIPEAAGGAAWLVSPDEPEEVSSTLELVLQGGGEVKDRQRRGMDRARELTWERAAGRVERLYDEVLKDG
jgi:glycosyltransferase involved in cell wall biosynthesis